MMAGQPLNAAHRALVMKRRVRILAGHVAATMEGPATVLDIGCGDGTLARAVMAAQPGLSFHGIDVFLRAQVAIPAIAYDGARIPYDDKAFDFVTLIDVVHHADDAEELLSEAFRVARRGVIVKDHLVEGIAARPTLCFMDWVGNRGHGVRLPYNYLRRAEWTRLLEGCGAQVECWDEQLGIYPFPFSLAFDRGLHFVARLAPPAPPVPAMGPARLEVAA